MAHDILIKELRYRYKSGRDDAVAGLSHEFPGGSVTAVVGPSGCGKTTLLSLLAGLDRPSSGEIIIDGDSYDTIDLDLLRRERVAMVFQAFHLLPLLTVLENVSYPAQLNGMPGDEAMARAALLLEKVGIGEDKLKRYPSKLSGGEQQRVAIARAMAGGARVLLADEPTGNLDTDNSEMVMNILRQLAHDEGYLVIIVTHDQDIADASDTVLRMKAGNFV